MKKEVVCHVSTNEEGETVQVRRVLDDPKYFLFSQGQNRMVLSLQELIEAVETIVQFSEVFETQDKMQAKAAAPKLAEVKPIQPEIIFEVQNHGELTPSEQYLKDQGLE